MRTDRGADRVRRLRIAGRALWWVGLFCLVPPLIAAWADVRSVMRAFAALPTRVAPGSPAAAWRFAGVLFFGVFSLLLSGLLRLELYREGGADGTNAPAEEGKGETGTRAKTLRRKTESVGCSLVIIAGVLCCVLLSLFAPDGYLFNTPPVFLGAFVFDSAYVYVALYALAAASCSPVRSSRRRWWNASLFWGEVRFVDAGRRFPVLVGQRFNCLLGLCS